MSELNTRFREIIDTDKVQMKIDIVGAGSTGSNLAMLLARLGIVDITVYDNDTVEGHNLGHQAFRVQDIGKSKVEVLAEIVEEATGTKIKTVNEFTDGSNIRTDILVLALDTMSGRKEVAEKADAMFIIDSRMGGEGVTVYATGDKDRHASTLFPDEEAAPMSCGGRAIGYTSYIAVALMEIVIKRIMLGEEYPFEQEFCCKNLYYNTTK